MMPISRPVQPGASLMRPGGTSRSCQHSSSPHTIRPRTSDPSELFDFFPRILIARGMRLCANVSRLECLLFMLRCTCKWSPCALKKSNFVDILPIFKQIHCLYCHLMVMKKYCLHLILFFHRKAFSSGGVYCSEIFYLIFQLLQSEWSFILFISLIIINISSVVDVFNIIANYQVTLTP